MWIILTILLAITCMWLIKVNKDLVDRNEYLIRQEDNKSRPHKLMMDTENKVIVFRFPTSNISENGLRQLSDDAKHLKGKGYEILVMDNTFDFSEINISKEELEKLKRRYDKLNDIDLDN